MFKLNSGRIRHPKEKLMTLNALGNLINKLPFVLKLHPLGRQHNQK